MKTKDEILKEKMGGQFHMDTFKLILTKEALENIFSAMDEYAKQQVKNFNHLPNRSNLPVSGNFANQSDEEVYNAETSNEQKLEDKLNGEMAVLTISSKQELKPILYSFLRYVDAMRKTNKLKNRNQSQIVKEYIEKEIEIGKTDR